MLVCFSLFTFIDSCVPTTVTSAFQRRTLSTAMWRKKSSTVFTELHPLPMRSSPHKHNSSRRAASYRLSPLKSRWLLNGSINFLLKRDAGLRMQCRSVWVRVCVLRFFFSFTRSYLFSHDESPCRCMSFNLFHNTCVICVAATAPHNQYVCVDHWNVLLYLKINNCQSNIWQMTDTSHVLERLNVQVIMDWALCCFWTVGTEDETCPVTDSAPLIFRESVNPSVFDLSDISGVRLSFLKALINGWYYGCRWDLTDTIVSHTDADHSDTLTHRHMA